MRRSGAKSVSADIRIHGDKPNLRLLMDDLRNLANFDDEVGTSLETTPLEPGALNNAEQAVLIISTLTNVGVGVLSAALYDGIKSAIRAARRRGKVHVTGLEPDDPPSKL